VRAIIVGRLIQWANFEFYQPSENFKRFLSWLSHWNYCATCNVQIWL